MSSAANGAIATGAAGCANDRSGADADNATCVLARATTPWGKARAAYWSGRAADVQGKADLAAKWYAAGAENMGTFYGQLSAHQLGNDAPPHPLPEPHPSDAELADFNARPLVQAAMMLAPTAASDPP